MRIRAVISVLENFAPPALQESWDNTGLQIGNPMDECSGALLCLDVTEAVIAEAVDRGCNLVVSHHPLIFKGLKRISPATAVGRTVLAAIRAGVAVYSTHTALDSALGGVSYEMARLLGLRPVAVLDPKAARSVRLEASVPEENADDARLALLDCGCASTVTVPASRQSLGENRDADSLDWETDVEPRALVSVCVPDWELRNALSALDGLALGSRIELHVSRLEDSSASLGLGVVARVPDGDGIPMSAFAEKVKRTFGVKRLRISSGVNPDAPVRVVALCGGSGGEFIPNAVRAGADVYVTADIRYHDFGDFNPEICLMDVGHFESEICTKDIFYRLLTKKIPNFAVYKSELEKNPVNYL